MGILNTTPDSFSDGGKYNKIDKALKKADQMIKDGADIIDIGGESSGPGSKNIQLQEEIDRVLPVLKKIREISDIPISIDTYKSQVAEQSLNLGANIINDVTSLRADKKMAQVIASYKCPCIIMYSKDPNARTTIKNKKYQDVLKDIKAFLNDRINFAQAHKIPKNKIIIDPGMGHFVSSNPFYSYQIIANLNKLKEIAPHILIGISRKSFLGGSIAERDQIGIPLTAIAYLNGANIIRTHNVKITKEFFNQFK